MKKSKSKSKALWQAPQKERAALATAMGRKRWKGTTAAARSAHMSGVARDRWANMSDEERAAFAARAADFSPGRPQDPRKKRCPCGVMTLKRAKTRADTEGTGLGHKKGCTFYRALPHK